MTPAITRQAPDRSQRIVRAESPEIPRLEALAPKTPVVIFAPHPDDEVIGCGGTIARLCQRGCTVDIVYVTDGAASHRGSPLWPQRRLREMREREAARGAAQLGLGGHHLHFMRAADGKLDMPGYDLRGLAERMQRKLVRFNPKVVFSPWIFDRHGDHRIVAHMVRKLLRGSKTALFEYDVWPAPAGRSVVFGGADGECAQMVDVQKYQRRKAAALNEHGSQLGLHIFDAVESFTLPESLRARVYDLRETFMYVASEAR